MATVRRWIPALLAGWIVFALVTFVTSLLLKVDFIPPALGLLAGLVASARVAQAHSLGQWLLAAVLMLTPIVAIAGALLLTAGGCPICPR